ncbi:MAG: hypothetical protein WAT81_03295 [Candidatus Moraniibacteriota bacterium]
MRTLGTVAVERMFRLGESSYRPPAILKLKEEIEGATRVLELRTSVTGVIDCNEVDRIVGMKLQLNALYADWVEGKLD